MVKKRLFICMALIFVSFAFLGCTNNETDNPFKGNYSLLSAQAAEETLLLLQDMDSFWTKMKVNAKTTMYMPLAGSQSSTEEAYIDTENKLMSLTTRIGSDKASVYIKDDMVYYDFSNFSIAKGKYKMTIEEYAAFGEEIGVGNYSSYIEMLGDASEFMGIDGDLLEGAQVYATAESGARNIKIIYSDKDGTDTTIYVKLNAAGEAVIMRMEVSFSVAEEGYIMSILTKMDIELYNGGITFPSDLDSYADFTEYLYT